MLPGVSPKTITTYAVSSAGGDRVVHNISNDFNLAAIGLRIVNGEIVVGTNPASAVQAGGAANAIANVRLQAKNEARLDVTGYELALLHRISHQGSIIQVDPALTVGTNAFEFAVKRQFVMPRMFAPFNTRGILPNKLVRDVQLIIDIGTPQDVLRPGSGGSVAFGANMRLEVTEYAALPTPADPNFYLNEQVFALRSDSVLTSTGEKEIRLNTFGKYRFLILYSRSRTSGVWSQADNLVSEVKLMSNKTEIDRRSWGAIKADNVDVFNLQSQLPGVAVLDFTRDGDPSQLLDADQIRADGSDLSLYPVVGTAAADSLFGVVGVRIWDNPALPLIPPTTLPTT